MDLSALMQRAGKKAAEKSPAILTAIGVTGTLTTAYLAAKGAFKAAEAIHDHAIDKKEEIGYDDDGICRESVIVTNRDLFDLTWKYYTPAAVSAAMTITAIVCANRVSDKRAAAMASAYSVMEKGFKEYREKNLEKIGKKKEQEVRDEIAQDRVSAEPMSKNTLIITNKGDVLCKDSWTGRYFTSSKNEIDKAVNDFNQQLINESYLSMSEWYHLIGIPATAESDDVGWDTDRLLEVDISGTIHEDGTPCLFVEYRSKPNPHFHKLY